MTSKLFTVPLLLAGSLLLRAHLDGNGNLSAQARQPGTVSITRMFTGADGLSHLQLINMPMSQLIKVAAVQFNRSSSTVRSPRTIEFHNAPHRRYVVTLSGAAEIEVSGDKGKKFVADHDHILLAEDTTGKGHTTRPIGSDDWVALFVEVDSPAPALAR